MEKSKRKQLFQIHEDLCVEALELMHKKNADYGGIDDPFANFELSNTLLGIPREQGMLLRLSDKLARLGKFEQSGNFQVTDESLKDTTLDIINYAILYYASHSLRKVQPELPHFESASLDNNTKSSVSNETLYPPNSPLNILYPQKDEKEKE